MTDLSATMAKLLGDRDRIIPALDQAEKDYAKHSYITANLQVDHDEANALALVRYQNERKDITKAKAFLAVKDAYRSLIVSKAMKAEAYTRVHSLTKQLDVITSSMYALNSEIKAGL